MWTDRGPTAALMIQGRLAEAAVFQQNVLGGRNRRSKHRHR